MISGSDKTRLDHIIELYNKRIDDAIEAVCDKYPPIEIKQRNPIAENLHARGMLRSVGALDALEISQDELRSAARGWGQTAALSGRHDFAGMAGAGGF